MLSLFAQEFEVERYCFVSPVQRDRIFSKLSSITVPVDKLTKEGSCLVVTTSPHRRELLQRFVRNLDPDVSVAFSSAEINREPCHLKVERIRVSKSDNVQGEVSTYPSVNATVKEASGTDMMMIQTLKDFELTVNQDEIKGSCRSITPDRYEVTIKVRKTPKPLTPPLQPGTIVVINTPPPDQETFNLETQLQLSRGTKVELGSIVKELREKSHEAKADPSLTAETESKNNSEKVFLSLN